ncbi:MAG: chemotaxis protein CheW [Candidatus Gastranaerophilales bacterium]|nr:chemotaxis protein CheW [Candidatus Gastranaerophilales bacterium]
MIEEFKGLKKVQMIIFRLGNEEYAVPITCIHEIIMPQTPTHIPKSPSFVEGIINLRGHIIPIIDGKKKFMLDVKKTDLTGSRIMVVDIDNEIIGLIVDEVSEVIHLNTEDIEPPPIDMSEDADFLWGVGKFENRLLILINPKKFLNTHEITNLKKVTKAVENISQVKKVKENEIVTTA